jgi:hypothetical protein
MASNSWTSEYICYKIFDWINPLPSVVWEQNNSCVKHAISFGLTVIPFEAAGLHNYLPENHAELNEEFLFCKPHHDGQQH